jgi:2-polyprenyl-3-methyl-5-hydroxy-6-metoxy-1,4-benzoquinol methylase
MEHAEFYKEGFYLDQKDTSYRSATIILDYFFRYYTPKSVVDVGCGLGTWLKVCRGKGVESIKGYDVNELPSEQLRDKIRNRRLSVKLKKLIGKLTG